MKQPLTIVNGVHEGCWVWKNELLDIFDFPLDVGFSEGFQVVQNGFFISLIHFDAHFLDFLLYFFPTDMLNDVVLFGFNELVTSLHIWTVEIDRVGLEAFKVLSLLDKFLLHVIIQRKLCQLLSAGSLAFIRL